MVYGAGTPARLPCVKANAKWERVNVELIIDSRSVVSLFHCLADRSVIISCEGQIQGSVQESTLIGLGLIINQVCGRALGVKRNPQTNVIFFLF